MSESFFVRSATVADADEIARHRRGMLHDMGYTDSTLLDRVEHNSRPYVARALREGTLHAWLACTPDGSVAGGGAVVVNSSMPHTYAPDDLRRPLILNVYTYPEFRRRGVARAIMQTILAWCRDQGFSRVTLHASDEGRPLYESLGFRPSNEMSLDLRQERSAV